MERADFVHLVRLSEHASAENSVSYRRSVAAFAALGYAWVLGCLGLSAGVLWWVAAAAMQGRLRGWYLWLVLAAAGLLWTSLRALWFKLEPPDGVRLQPRDAPALFEAIERVRKGVKGPPVHEVRLDGDLNASIAQRPRWGLFGGARNHLTVGLPLLMAVDHQRFLAILAHEYGHLRGDHGRFAAWIYRTRLSWARLHENLDGDEGVVGAITQSFLRWYFPRFVAKTFALARQDEYEADRIAGRLLGNGVAGASLVEVNIKSHWLQQHFWPGHWLGAARSPTPLGPYASMRKMLALPPPDAFAQRTLRQALRQVSDVDDTHPVLRDRLEALEVAPALPAWSERSAIELLGKQAPRWILHFDVQWCRDNASAWKEHHRYLARVRARVDALSADLATRNAEELVELADLKRRLDAQALVDGHYQQALEKTPGHPSALRGLIECLPPTQRERKLSLLQLLHDSSAAYRWWAARTAVALLEADPDFDVKALQAWRERLKAGDAIEERAWEELTETPTFEAIARHDLSEFERGEVLAELARCAPVARAWLVRKNLRELAWRRSYLIFLELPGMHDADRWELCRDLERSLSLPGPTLALWAGESPTLEEIERNAGAPIYTRG